MCGALRSDPQLAQREGDTSTAWLICSYINALYGDRLRYTRENKKGLK